MLQVGKESRRTIYATLAIITGCFALASVTQATTIESTASGGYWYVPSTWVGGQVPGANDDVVINGSVSLNFNTQEANNLTVNPGGSLSVYNAFPSGDVRRIAIHGLLDNQGTIGNSGSGNIYVYDGFKGISPNNGFTWLGHEQSPFEPQDDNLKLSLQTSLGIDRDLTLHSVSGSGPIVASNHPTITLQNPSTVTIENPVEIVVDNRAQFFNLTAPEGSVVVTQGGFSHASSFDVASLTLSSSSQTYSLYSGVSWDADLVVVSEGATVAAGVGTLGDGRHPWHLSGDLHNFGQLGNRLDLESGGTIYHEGTLDSAGTAWWAQSEFRLTWEEPTDTPDSYEYHLVDSPNKLSSETPFTTTGRSTINLRSILNAQEPYYFTVRPVYHHLLGPNTYGPWSEIRTINVLPEPITVPEDFFTFDLITDVTLPSQPNVTIYAADPAFSGRLYLSAGQHDIYPRVIDMSNGQWNGNVRFFHEQGNQQLTVRSGDKDGESNLFDVDPDSSIPRYGTLQGRVPQTVNLVGETINLTDERNTQYQTTIQPNGSFTITNVECGSYNLTVPGTVLSKPTVVFVDVVCGETVDVPVEILPVCDASNLTPVLLVPGMQGSTINTTVQDTYPNLPAHSPAWSSGELKQFDPFNQVGWENLRESFEAQGYTRGCNMFDVPYDWTLPLDQTVEQYLKPWIDHAKSVASSTQVDVVAHSMGGLVTRTYIQDPELYENDIRRFAMVGTPNMGSAKAFYSWNSGDPVAADFVTGSIAGAKIPYTNIVTGVADNFTSEAIMEIHRIRGSGEELCQWQSTVDRVDRVTSVGDEDNFSTVDIRKTFTCDRERVYDFVTASAPAIKALLPTYDNSIYNVSIKQYSELSHHENTFLKNLNHQNCSSEETCGFSHPSVLISSTTDTRLFVGKTPIQSYAGDENTQSTPYQVPVRTRFSYEGVGGFNADGVSLLGATYTNGDGTVSYDSVVFDAGIFGSGGVVERSSASDDQSHESLIRHFIDEIVNYIK